MSVADPSIISDLSNAPDSLVPRMGNLPVSSTRHYTTVTMTKMAPRPGGTRKVDGALGMPNPMPMTSENSSDKSPPPGWQPAEGVILSHEQGWFAQGVALGRLLHSVCLAPGEITQVAVSKLSRSARGSTQADATGSESLVHEEEQQSALTETQDAVATEVQSGYSRSSTNAKHGQSGVSGIMGGLGVSASGALNSSVVTSVGMSAGQRDVAATSNQRVHQSAQQHARLARSQQRTAVSEISERESVELNARVVVNYNHVHALTMQYFEVMQVYRLETRITRAERCLFVPMIPIDFSSWYPASTKPRENEAVPRPIHGKIRESLARAALAMGSRELATAIHLSKFTDELKQAHLRTAEENLVACESRLEQARALLDGTGGTGGLREKREAATDALLSAKDALRASSDQGLARRAKLQGEVSRHAASTKALRAEVGEAVEDVRRLEQAYSEARAAVDAIIGSQAFTTEMVATELDRHRLAFNQAIWMQMDASTVGALLGNRTYTSTSGNDKRVSRLAQSIDPRPVAVSGHHVAFRWNFDTQQEAAEFQRLFMEREVSPPVAQVSLPTDGVFAEAVLGVSKGAEKIDRTRFWNWNDALPPLLPAQIETITEPDARRAKAPSLPGAPPSHLKLNPLAFPQTASGLREFLGAASEADMFRDMSGGDLAAGLANAAAQHAASGADQAAKHANANFKRYLELQQELLGMAAEGKLDPTSAGARINARAAADPMSRTGGGASLDAGPNGGAAADDGPGADGANGSRADGTHRSGAGGTSGVPDDQLTLEYERLIPEADDDAAPENAQTEEGQE